MNPMNLLCHLCERCVKGLPVAAAEEDVMMDRKCLVCGRKLGLFTKKIKVKRGYICAPCVIRKAVEIKGMRVIDKNNVSYEDLKDVLKQLNDM